MNIKKLEVYGLKIPLIEKKTDLAKVIVDTANEMGIKIIDRDVIAISSKLVSKALGSMVKLDSIEPSRKALKLAKKINEDPRFIELLLRESDSLLAVIPIKKLVEEGLIDIKRISRKPEEALKAIDRFPVLFLVMRENSLWTDAGLDSSNLPDNYIAIPPRNLDMIAKEIRDRIYELTGSRVAVVICDTEGFLGGSLDFARGSYGIEPVDRCFGDLDLYGKPKFGGVDIIVHEICATAALLSKQTGVGIPVVIIRGLDYEECECSLRDRRVVDITRWKKVLRLIAKYTIRVLGIKHILKLLF